MQVEFDPAKEEANVAKHGVPLSLAEKLDWNSALVWLDDRGKVCRTISLRRAERREVKHYVENI